MDAVAQGAQLVPPVNLSSIFRASYEKLWAEVQETNGQWTTVRFNYATVSQEVRIYLCTYSIWASSTLFLLYRENIIWFQRTTYKFPAAVTYTTTVSEETTGHGATDARTEGICESKNSAMNAYFKLIGLADRPKRLHC